MKFSNLMYHTMFCVEIYLTIRTYFWYHTQYLYCANHHTKQLMSYYNKNEHFRLLPFYFPAIALLEYLWLKYFDTNIWRNFIYQNILLWAAISLVIILNLYIHWAKHLSRVMLRFEYIPSYLDSILFLIQITE